MGEKASDAGERRKIFGTIKRLDFWRSAPASRRREPGLAETASRPTFAELRRGNGAVRLGNVANGRRSAGGCGGAGRRNRAFDVGERERSAFVRSENADRRVDVQRRLDVSVAASRRR